MEKKIEDKIFNQLNKKNKKDTLFSIQMKKFKEHLENKSPQRFDKIKTSKYSR